LPAPCHYSTKIKKVLGAYVPCQKKVVYLHIIKNKKQMSKQISYRELSENFVKSRSERDYNALYLRVKPGLKNYIANVVKDSEATDDILTNTLTKMWTKIDQYDPSYQITTWLYRIAFNECLGWIRQRNAKYSIETMKDYGIEISDQYANTSARELLIEAELKTESDWLEEDNDLQNRYELALTSIDNLKPMYKEIIEDRLINQMKYEDIATKYDLPLQTVKNRIRRGKSIIAENMGF
jgi:RNA polymerase sigma-70 factor, ECF subfamily